MKRGSKPWKSLSADEKKPYEDKAAEAKKIRDQAVVEYHKSKGV